VFYGFALGKKVVGVFVLFVRRCAGLEQHKHSVLGTRGRLQPSRLVIDPELH
jgi:hypothetical protein